MSDKTKAALFNQLRYRLLLYLVVALVLIMPLRTALEQHFLYFPITRHEATPASIGLSFEEVRFKNGRILDENFHTYEIPRFSWLPEIETIIIDNMDKPAQGGGEPALVGMGAVIATGIHDATGAKMFRLPVTPARVKEALGKV